MPHPIGYYASAPSNTNDATVLMEIEEEFGSWLERLTLSQKITWAIALLSEVLRSKEIEVIYKNAYNAPGLNQPLQLSHSNKLALVKALVDYVQYADVQPEIYQFSDHRS